MTFTLLSPLKGWVGPLDEIPDAVFAERMLGDGIALDPTGGTLYAPCDAKVMSVAKTEHAITLRAENGAEILIHIGLETVALGGAGFTVHVTTGREVKAGQPLIDFDLDFLVRRANSLLTPILITNPDAFAIEWRARDREIEVGEPLMSLRPLAAPAVNPETPVEVESQTLTLTLGFPHGLHARPAARVAALAKTFHADLSLSATGRTANAKSPLALMTLGVAAGQTLELAGRGADAVEALQALSTFLTGDGGEAATPELPPPDATTLLHITDRVLKGVCAASGRAIGPTFQFRRAPISVSGEGRGVDLEKVAFDAALATTKNEIAGSAATPQGGEIMAAHLALLDDPDLIAAANVKMAEGDSAATAWSTAVDVQIDALKALADPRLRDRAQDLIDLKRQVLIALGGKAAAPDAPEGVILLADDLLPSELLAVGGRIKGLCTAAGGATSHVAIIAASLAIPTLAAAGAGVLAVEQGTMAILDASAGTLTLDPSETDLARERRTENRGQAAAAAAKSAAAADCRMADGTRIEVFANLASIADAQGAVSAGAEGCGLLRSEFLFMDRLAPPDEDEQHAAYQAVADGLDGRPLTIRTLDIGGDKPVAYLPLPKEENPALGLRGVRTSLWRPDLLQTQLRAILRVRPIGVCKIMVPMVASVHELLAVRAMLDEARRSLGTTEEFQLGVMIETPASAVTASSIATVADFLSIGTNDLTQYALAMDRGHPALARDVDALHPAVLRMIQLTGEGAKAQGRWVGVCGAVASEPIAAPLLIGLGVTELSVTPSLIPQVKAAIRPLTLASCQALANAALQETSASGVRALLGGPAERALKAVP